MTDRAGSLDDQDAWGQLLKPWAATRWFVAEPPPVLELDATGFSAANAWWLAELSRLSYRNAQRAPVLAAAGLREVAFISRGGTQCLIAVSLGDVPEVACCVFRGTDEGRDWWSNLRWIPADWSEGGRVHRGFRCALDDAWDGIAGVLRELALPVLVGGHSLGGALAFLAASRLRPVGCYGFGAPRVGDAGFAATLEGIPTFRVVHGRDLVPGLTPSTPAFRFADAGEDVVVSGVVDTPRWNDPPAPLADHAPVRYVEAMRRRLPGAGAS